MRRDRPLFIYLIEAEIGFVKIGYSHQPRVRLQTMAGTSVCPLRLIAQWPGGSAEEKALHERFANYRLHGEWFQISGALAAFVLEVWGCGVPSIPRWPDKSPAAREQRKRDVAARRSETHLRNWADPEFRKMQEAAAEARRRRAA
jgi:hypothetical protein